MTFVILLHRRATQALSMTWLAINFGTTGFMEVKETK